MFNDIQNLNGFSLEPGSPRLDKYNDLLNSKLFRELEKFSENFIQDMPNHLSDLYWKKQPLDSLHTINRQWEYPFVIYSLAKWRTGSTDKDPEKSPRLIDFGSGFTFFPWLISQNGWEIACIDRDASLQGLFASVEKQSNIRLDIVDDNKLPYPNDFFDAAIAVSVLEHTEQHEQIIIELNRVLRPGGILIITFDISLDNKTNITIPKAKELLRTTEKIFHADAALTKVMSELDLVKDHPEIFLTTDWARRLAPELLPWKLSKRRIWQSLRHFQFPHPLFFSLAFCCFTLTKECTSDL